MKAFITVLALVIPNLLFGQARGVKLFQSLDNVYTTSELTSIQGKIRLEEKYTEYLNLGIEKKVWLIYKGNRKVANKTRLLTLSHRNQIFYQEFFNSKNSAKIHTRVENNILFNLNKIVLKELGSNIDFEHLTRGDEKNTFGYRCYVSASMPYDGEKMLKLVNEENQIELINWLKSIDPVKQVYAYLGLKLLQSRNKNTLPSDIENILTFLEMSETSIFTCHGCTTWEYLQIKEILKKESVDQFIKINRIFRPL